MFQCTSTTKAVSCGKGMVRDRLYVYDFDAKGQQLGLPTDLLLVLSTVLSNDFEQVTKEAASCDLSAHIGMPTCLYQQHFSLK